MLTKEFRREFTEIIENYLSIKDDPKHKPRLKKIWKLEGNEFEFLYGQSVGFLTGIATGILEEKFNRDLTMDETNEIFEIIESYSRQIRFNLEAFK